MHFGSRGIPLSKRNDGRTELPAVNRGERESIEELELVHGSNGYDAVWRGCVTNREGLFNDVAATAPPGILSAASVAVQVKNTLAVAAILLVVAICASYLPARRAMRLDALVLLRDE
jgi:ABC-type antimicrobial peptide transport system permease subunit